MSVTVGDTKHNNKGSVMVIKVPANVYNALKNYKEI